MDLNILTAIIAASVSLFIGMLTLIATLLTTQAKIKTMERSFEEKYRKSIFDKRLEPYAEAWRITAKLSSLILKNLEITNLDEIKEVLMQLDRWYNSTNGGLLLSQESRQRFFHLRDIFKELPEIPPGSSEFYDELWRRKMNFRISLRYDLTLEKEPYQHKGEEWHLDTTIGYYPANE